MPVFVDKTVLIVEDNRVNQKILAKQLQKAGYKYIVAVNGLDAVEQYQTGSFDCILMDIGMPIMNGYEATKSIREINYCMIFFQIIHPLRRDFVCFSLL